ncbi:MAG: ribosome recycling factor [Patescibacteria group bacterium]
MDEAVVRAKMQPVLDLTLKDVSSIRTGRAAPSLIEDIIISAYGGTGRLRLVELATITTPDSQTLLISPWDKSIIGEIKQSILTANIGVNPSMDSDAIRISFPPMTTEDREKYVKLLSTKIESGRIMIRQVRGEFMHEIKKVFAEKTISEDEKFQREKNLQKITDDFMAKIEEIFQRKKSELMQI